MMKVFAISDLHLSTECDKPMDIFGGAWCDYWDKIRLDWNERVCNEDVVLVAGDLSWGMKLNEAVADLRAIGDLNGKKIIIRGNHDLWWSSYTRVKQVLPENMFAIQNNAIRMNGYVFFGTRGWSIPDGTESENDRAIFQRELIRLRLSLDSADKLRQEGDKLIGMIHFPPFLPTYADTPLTELFEEYNIPVVVYGHLHGTACRKTSCVEKGNTKYFLTSCDFLENKLLDITDF